MDGRWKLVVSLDIRSRGRGGCGGKWIYRYIVNSCASLDRMESMWHDTLVALSSTVPPPLPLESGFFIGRPFLLRSLTVCSFHLLFFVCSFLFLVTSGLPRRRRRAPKRQVSHKSPNGHRNHHLSIVCHEQQPAPSASIHPPTKGNSER